MSLSSVCMRLPLTYITHIRSDIRKFAAQKPICMIECCCNFTWMTSQFTCNVLRRHSLNMAQCHTCTLKRAQRADSVQNFWGMRFDILHGVIVRVAARDVCDAEQSFSPSPPQFIHRTVTRHAVQPWQQGSACRGEPAEVTGEPCKRLFGNVLGQVPVVQDTQSIGVDVMVMTAVQDRNARESSRASISSCWSLFSCRSGSTPASNASVCASSAQSNTGMNRPDGTSAVCPSNWRGDMPGGLWMYQTLE